MLQKSTLARLLTFWNSKIPILLSVVYYLLWQGNIHNFEVITHIMLFLVSSVGFGLTGYFINDWTDIEENKQQGKINTASSLSVLSRWAFVLVALVLAISPWFWLLFNYFTGLLLTLQIISYVLYSVRPFRIKERGWGGVLFDSFYAHFLPALLLAYTFSVLYNVSLASNVVAIAVFLCWVVTVGVRNIMMHQLSDFEADTAAGVSTYAISLGQTKAVQFKNRLLVPVELLLLLLILWILPELYPIPYLFPAYMLYVFYREANRLKRIMREGGDVVTSRYDFFSEVVLNEFYEKWLPVMLLLMQFANPFFRWLLVVHAILFFKNTIRFAEDFWFVFQVIVMQLKYLVWFAYHRILLKVLHVVYYPAKHVVYWYVLMPLKKMFAK